MRTLVSIGILIVFVAGYQSQQDKPQTNEVHGAGQYAPPKTSAAFTQTASIKQEYSCYQKAKNYLREAFGPEYLAAWVLVLAACIGLYATFRTLAILREQTCAAKKSAEAALLNAQAVINNVRPWVMVKTVQPTEKYWDTVVMTETSKGKPIYAVPLFKNYGDTPAWIVQSTAFLKTCNDEVLEKSLDYGQPPDYPNPRPLPQGKEPIFILNALVEGEKVLNPQEIRALESGDIYLILYGFLKYKDPFFEQTKKYRKTCFCFRYYRALDLWQPYGPPGANEHT